MKNLLQKTSTACIAAILCFLGVSVQAQTTPLPTASVGSTVVVDNSVVQMDPDSPCIVQTYGWYNADGVGQGVPSYGLPMVVTKSMAMPSGGSQLTYEAQLDPSSPCVPSSRIVVEGTLDYLGYHYDTKVTRGTDGSVKVTYRATPRRNR